MWVWGVGVCARACVCMHPPNTAHALLRTQPPTHMHTQGDLAKDTAETDLVAAFSVVGTVVDALIKRCMRARVCVSQ